MTATLAHICRHPIKSHGRELLASVLLSEGACLPFDRHWAVAHDAARLEPGTWAKCTNFSRGAKAPALMAIRATLDETTRQITLAHPDRPDLTFDPDAASDLPRFLEWVTPLCPANRAQPARIVQAGRGMTDSPFPSVAILSLASNRALAAQMGQPLSIHRWRGNLWLDDLSPFVETGWIGRTLKIGDALLRIEEPITRCRATMADPDTGRIDGDTLAALETMTGMQDFGLYATVVKGGPIALQSPVELVE
jgi:uncharacterized protein